MTVLSTTRDPVTSARAVLEHARDIDLGDYAD
jgi:hypothetical protein